MAGHAFAIVGPSGAGKDTLMRRAARLRPDLRIVRRTITRSDLSGPERFDPVTPEEFAALRDAGAFALHWEAHGLCYGLPRSMEQALDEGRDMLFNASRSVLLEAREAFPDLTVVHVTAPAPILASRLAARGRESGKAIARRLARAGYGIPDGLPVHVVVNDGPLTDVTHAFLAALQPDSA